MQNQIEPSEKPVADMSYAELAKQEFEPWSRDEHPGPSAEEWQEWNLTHGTALRIACSLMQQDKKALVDFCADLNEAQWSELNRVLDTSHKFFSDMATVLNSARCRLLVATAAAAQRELN